MKTILFLFFSFFIIASNGQNIERAGVDSWKVEHNGKQKLKASAEDPAKNMITLTKADLKKSGTLVVSYKEISGQKGWQRSITLFDEKDNELLKGEGALLKVANTKLAALAATYHTIKIYSWALPTDPNVAATVRIRRVHLCTILIK